MGRMGSEGKLCLLQMQNQHPEAMGDSAGVGAEVCSWPGSLGAAKSQGPLLLLQHGLCFGICKLLIPHLTPRI